MFRQHLAGRVREPRSQPPDRIELADQYSGSRRGGLTDLIERELDEALEPHRRHPYPERTAGVVPVSRERGSLGEREQRVGEPVDARDAGERVVDRGRQSANRDLDDLRDSSPALDTCALPGAT